ncbi:MAG: DUF5667 domain-containing protein [Bacillota bacterium]
MKNKKLISILSTSVMTSALIFSYGGGIALASENDTSDVEITDESTVQTEINNKKTSTTIETTEEDEATAAENVGSPSLVPGDFFYFVKLMTEKIRLTITLDDYKEAKLLANFAAERIAEANKLLTEGKQEEAQALLEKAIEQQTLASDQLEESTLEESSEDENTNEASVENTQEQSTNSEEEDEVEEKLGQNIDALLVALDKVENPKAQAALSKNIEKSFAKLDKKIQRLEEKNKKKDERQIVDENTSTEQQTDSEDTEIETVIDVKDEVSTKVEPKENVDSAVTSEVAEKKNNNESKPEVRTEKQHQTETTKVETKALDKQEQVTPHVSVKEKQAGKNNQEDKGNKQGKE